MHDSMSFTSAEVPDGQGCGIVTPNLRHSITFKCQNSRGSQARTVPMGYYRCQQLIATNLGKHRLTRHRSALPENLTSSRPRSLSLGNATLVVAERSG